MNNPYVRYAITVLVVLAVAEFAPNVVNTFLLLVLIGMLLMNTKAITSLAAIVGTVGK